ncbi:MAG: guanylate kinase [Proteobacteria bacterium]|nr:guanylate kinase [Pseudomonadota bacterium]
MANIFIVSAPSGAGKSSLIDALTEKDNRLKKSISVTTRQPRQGEQNGQHYLFTDEIDFQKRLSNGDFLEYAQVHGNWYGTSRLLVENELKNNNDLVLEIDYQGAQIIRSLYADSISIFILPPNKALLRSRLEKRNTDAPTTIEQRLKAANTEIAHISEYQYVTINDNFDDAVADLEAIVRSTRLAAHRHKSEHIIQNFLKDD